MAGINEEAVLRLQQQIDRSLGERAPARVTHIELDRGSEVTDLTRCADVRVFLAGDQGFRLFSIATVAFLTHVLSGARDYHPRSDVRDLYTRGGPLIVVREISGDVIVRGVLYYLDMEAGRGGA